MKVRLMAPDEDFDPEAVGPDLPPGVADWGTCTRSTSYRAPSW